LALLGFEVAERVARVDRVDVQRQPVLDRELWERPDQNLNASRQANSSRGLEGIKHALDVPTPNDRSRFRDERPASIALCEL